MSTIEKLRVYKQVCLKIRSALVSGREDLVSPTCITKTFFEEEQNELNRPLSFTCLENGISREDVLTEVLRGEENGYHQPCSQPCSFVEEAEGWRVEYCEYKCQSCGSEALCMCNKEALRGQFDLRQMDESVYRQHFLDEDHWNFFTEEPDIGPVLLSLKQEHDQFRLLVRSSDHYLHGLVPISQLDCNKLSQDEVAQAVGRAMNLLTILKPVQHPNISLELLRVDETFVKNHLKIGVMQVKSGQHSEEDIFANDHQPGPFDEFLNLLGKRVKLLGFKKFLGGLDGDRNLTGEHSVFTEYQSMEVMFHVSTLIPFTANDPQQVNKKRHIGNDIVCIVFLDKGAVFNPTCIRSHFIHSYIVVQHIVGSHGQPLYRMAVTSRSSVPSFTPDLSAIPSMPHCSAFQSLLLSKVINAERACYHAPKFFKLTNRSRAQLLIELVATLTEHSMAAKHGRATRKVTRRGSWLPIGLSRPPSPLLDPVREKYTNADKLVDDFSMSFKGPEIADVVFIVGPDKVPLYGVKSLLACRSKVFRTMFNEGQSRMSSPQGSRRRINSSSTGNLISNCHSPRLTHKSFPSPTKSRLIHAVSSRKKKATSDGNSSPRAASVSPELQQSPSPFLDEPRHCISEQYIIEEFSETVFSQLLRYLITGSCAIQPSTIVGITCTAEHYEIPELKQACFDRLPSCLTGDSVCMILTQLEKYLSYHCAKTMVVRALEFVDSNAEHVLTSEGFVYLSENMVHLILRRDIDVAEIVRVNAALAWGKRNVKQGQDFKKVIHPLVKNVRLHLIDAQDMMKVVVPSGLFENEKVMAALAFQVDPNSVEITNYTMFQPRKKGSVLSSRY